MIQEPGPAPQTSKPSAGACVRRGLALKCPACGRGRLFRAYLKPVEHCGACSEDFTQIQADDGPAWATILLVGHLISPVFFVFATTDGPAWTALAAVSALVLAMTFYLLPRMKGLFIALIWVNGAGDSKSADTN